MFFVVVVISERDITSDDHPMVCHVYSTTRVHCNKHIVLQVSEDTVKHNSEQTHQWNAMLYQQSEFTKNVRNVNTWMHDFRAADLLRNAMFVEYEHYTCMLSWLYDFGIWALLRSSFQDWLVWKQRSIFYVFVRFHVVPPKTCFFCWGKSVGSSLYQRFQDNDMYFAVAN